MNGWKGVQTTRSPFQPTAIQWRNGSTMKIDNLTVRWDTAPKSETMRERTIQWERFRWRRLGRPGIGFGVVWVGLILIPIAIGIVISGLDAATPLLLCATAGAIYIGVPLHELAHAIPYWRYRERVAIHLYYKKPIFISGYTSMTGSVPYQALQKSLWAPIWIALSIVGCAVMGYLAGQPTGAAFLLYLGVLDLAACGYDLHWSWQIRRYGDRAKYFDRGAGLDIVWEEEGG